MSKTYKIICLDFETGGRNAKLNPAVELAAVAFDPVTNERLGEFSRVIAPYDDALVYEPEAMRIHGLSLANLKADGEPIRQVAKDFIVWAKTFSNPRRKPFLIGQNLSFDLGFLHEFLKAGVRLKEMSKTFEGYVDPFGNFQPYYEDTLIAGRNYWAGIKENFTLGDMCAYAGIQLQGAHRALNDVDATVKLYQFLRRTGKTAKKHEAEKRAGNKDVFKFDILK